MDINDLRQISIVDFLKRMGHEPVKCKGAELWYLAPYRSEKTPSFRVNTAKNVWMDFGTGKGGDIFTLAGEFIHSGDFMAQADFLAEDSGVPFGKVGFEPDRPKAVEPSFEEVAEFPLQHRALLQYLEERGIPAHIAKLNCLEIHYKLHGREYFAVGFRNAAGGYELRNRFFKGCIPPKDVSVVANGSDVCNVYEGFMDYLSAAALGIGETDDHLVLNSVSNMGKAVKHLDRYKRINCYLDNDEAGRRTLDALLAHYGGRIKDRSALYKDCKDLNEHLQQSSKK